MPAIHNCQRQLRMYAILAAQMMSTVHSAITQYTQTYYNKQDYHTSALSGAAWINELKNGHDERIKSELGVSKEVFCELINVLQDLGYSDSRHVQLNEQVGIFLYMCRTGMSVRHVGEHLQRSNDTVSK